MWKNGLLVVLMSLALLAAYAVAGTPITTGDTETAHAAKFFDAQKQLKKYEELSRQEMPASKGNASYNIVKETYIVNDERMDVAINYPQISGLGDDCRQKVINELLKKEALQILAIFSGPNDRGLIIAIHYKITWQSDNLLSVQ